MARPFRLDMFKEFANSFKDDDIGNALELGSGPGFLAQYLCQRISKISLTLLDFSNAMHELAKERLRDCRQDIEFICRDFRDPDWTHDLGKFDCVFSNQSIHELRHKSLAVTLHKQVRSLLVEGGIYLVCDHFAGPGGMKNIELYMTPDEQISSLEVAGFKAEVLLQKGSMQIVRAV